MKSSRRPGTNAFTPIRQSSSTRASGGKGNKRINRKVFFFRRGPFFFWGGVVLLRFRFVEIPKIALLPLLFKS